MNDYLLPPVHDWVEWGALFTDAALWRPAIVRLWATETPPLAVRTGLARVGRVTAGFPGTCAVFILDETVVIKFFPPMVAGDFIREREVYRLLAGRVPEMPRLLAGGVLRDRIAWPYLVTSFCPGQAWREALTDMLPAERLAIARTLGERIGRVHRTAVAPGGAWPSADAWPRFIEARLAAAPVALRASLPAAVAAAAGALLRQTDWFAGRPCLLHADLTEDHAFVAHRDGCWRLSGLLDWADAEVGDPLYEWVALYFGFCGRDAGLLRAFLAGYDPAAPLPARHQLLAYTLLHRFGLSIIDDILGREERRDLGSIDELAERLFPDFG